MPHSRPVKQKLRRLHPRWSLQVKEEIQKQLIVGFLSVVEYPEWLANVVPVPKKENKVRVCVNFRDLNKASPKDDFPLPHIDMLVDNTSGHPMLSFMDGFFHAPDPGPTLLANPNRSPGRDTIYTIYWDSR